MSDDNRPDDNPAQRPQPDYGAYRPPQQGNSRQEVAPTGDSAVDSEWASAPADSGNGQLYSPPGATSADSSATGKTQAGAPYQPYGSPAGYPGPSAYATGPAGGQSYSTQSGYPAQAPSHEGHPYGGTRPGVGSSQYYPPGQQMPPQGQMPGRAIPITMIVVGAVLAFVVAPLAFLGVLGAKVMQTSTIKGIEHNVASAPVQTREYSEGDHIIAVVVPDSDSWHCTATNPKGDRQVLIRREYNTYNSSRYIAEGEAQVAGKYTVECKSSQNLKPDRMILMDPAFVGQVSHSLILGLVVASVIGAVGLVLFIVGIVLLSKRNRLRRTLLSYSDMY